MNELIYGIESFAIAFLLTGAVLRYSLRRRLLDMPNERSSHEVPRPRLGGVAITAAFLVSLATMTIAGLRPLPGAWSGAGVLAAALLVAAVGLIDDLRGLDARLKLLAQIAGSAIVIASGVVMNDLRLPLVGTLPLGPLAVPVTIVWITGIINFYNFIDGIDGLAAGVGMIAAAFLVALAHLAGDPTPAVVYAALAGALFGFLRWNFPPAKIFMGDCGSTFVGFTFAVMAIAGAKGGAAGGAAGAAAGVPAVATLLLLGGVLGDAALTLLRRMIRREGIFSAHRTHYYQRLTSLGLSHKQVTLLEYLVAALLGVSAVLLISGEMLFVAAFAVIWVGFFLWAIRRIRTMERGDAGGGGTRALAVAAGDLVFIAASYVLSYYVRLNFAFPRAETHAMIASLPIILVIRTAVFQYYGLYRAVWRYTTFDDVIRTVKAVAVGSAVAVVLFTFLFRFEAFPRSVFIIDLFVLTFFMAGSRIVTRWFHELPAHEEAAGIRIAIGGTGHTGEAILHHVRRTKGLRAVGWLDDRDGMRGRIIHGLPVLGTIDDAEELAARREIDEIAAPASFAGRIVRERIEHLQRLGVQVRLVGDPAEIALHHSETSSALAGRRVLAAGDGPIVRAAGRLLQRAARVSLASSSADVLRAGSTGPGGPIGVLPGVLEDRDAVRRVIEARSPDVVIADFTFDEDLPDGPLEAFARTVLLPLERLAGEAARAGARFILVRRQWGRSDGPLAAARSLAVDAVRAAYARDPGLLCVIDAAEGAAEADLQAALDDAADCGGDLIVRRGAAESVSVERLESGPAPDGTDLAVLAFSRALAGGEDEIAAALDASYAGLRRSGGTVGMDHDGAGRDDRRQGGTG
jgi:UDP-GlcNAc:undecaprenyl-phosphate GlcNAc-1-phosphate transferase